MELQNYESTTVAQMAEDQQVIKRTIKRRIEKFNEANDTDHPDGYGAEITDPELLKFLYEFKTKSKEHNSPGSKRNGHTVQINGLKNDFSEKIHTSNKNDSDKSGEVVKKRNPTKESNIDLILNIAPLAMLGLAASYGVYHWSSHFLPTPFAVFMAGGFELIYIRLAWMKTKRTVMKKSAVWVALSAVGVSVIYNTFSAALKMNPGLLENLTVPQFWIVAGLHGLPIAVLGFLFANLLFHKNSK